MVILGKRNVRHLLTIPGRSTEPSHGLRRPVHQEKMQEEEQDLDRPPESISSEEEAEVVTEQDAEGFVDIDQLEVKAAEKAHTAQELPNAPSLSGDRRASRRECRNDATISATSSSPINGSPANSRKRKRQLESSAPAQAERPVFTVPSSSEVLGLSQMQHGMFFGTASQKSSQQTYGKRLWDTNVNGNIHATTKKQSGSQQSGTYIAAFRLTWLTLRSRSEWQGCCRARQAFR